MVSAAHLNELDYTTLDDDSAERVRQALSRGEKAVTGYMPDQSLDFAVRNYKRLSALGILEVNWMPAYLHAHHFKDIPLSLLRAVFDACDRNVLQRDYPIPPRGRFCVGERFSLFRGCAGPEHRMGMSWLTSLDKAIWYAAHHAAYYGLDSLAVYAAVAGRDEIYCCGEHYDYDYIVCPKARWRIDVPPLEFRLDRPR